MLFLLLKSLFNHLKKLILRITFDFFEYLKPSKVKAILLVLVTPFLYQNKKKEHEKNKSIFGFRNCVIAYVVC